MKILKTVAKVLVIVGALNWGLVGINEGLNVVKFILGSLPWLENTVYILVGLSALLLIIGGNCPINLEKETESSESVTESEPEPQV